MAKKNISARVPPHVADSIDQYAEVWNMNRTDTITVLLEHMVEGLPEPIHMTADGDSDPLELVYTLELEPENAEYLDDLDVTPQEGINNGLDWLSDTYGGD
jgi:hypothetical protein